MVQVVQTSIVLLLILSGAMPTMATPQESTATRLQGDHFVEAFLDLDLADEDAETAETSSSVYEYSAQLSDFSTTSMSRDSACCLSDQKWGYQRLVYTSDGTHSAEYFEASGGQIKIKKAGLVEVIATMNTDEAKASLIVGGSAFPDVNDNMPPVTGTVENFKSEGGACNSVLDGYTKATMTDGVVTAARWIDAPAGYLLNVATVPFIGNWFDVNGGTLSIKWHPLSNQECHDTQVTVTHWGACYRVKDPAHHEDGFLVEGARKMEAMGIKTFKTTLTAAVGPTSGPQNNAAEKETIWKDLLDMKDEDGKYTYTITDVAKHAVFRKIFSMDFTHYVLVTYTRAVTWDSNYYRTYGVSADNAAKETEEMRALTDYLLTEYAGTGKTFVLQNWEGDNVLEGGFNNVAAGAKGVKTRAEVQKGMIDWLAARQAGVEAGRKPYPNSDVKVFHAAEVCKVFPPFSNSTADRANDWATKSVLPHVTLDMASYSAYDSQQKFQFPEILDYLNSHLKKSDYVKNSVYADYPTYIGEYGMGEMMFKEDYVRIQPLMRMVVETCLKRNCPFAIFWQLYGNEEIADNGHSNGCDLFDENDPGSMKGYWIFRPDGTKWDLMYNLLKDYHRGC